MAFTIFLGIQVLLICTTAVYPTVADEAVDPVVTVKQGTITGVRTDFEAKELNIHTSVDAYFGIPYAEAPVGPLRFKPPVPKTWSGDLNAKEYGVACPQPVIPIINFRGRDFGEDCLLLDVFVPVPTPSDAAVMFWIHGGGYSLGAGTIPGMDSSPVAAIGDVIVVAIQYRLGALGFLSTGDEEVPGNMGMLDQIEALKWVQDNIAAFGGDPNRVTIFGESAGGGSVSVLTLSPLSKGLFVGAIMQSGVAITPWAVNINTDSYMKIATGLGGLVGCDAKESKPLVECLREVPAEDLVNATTYQMPELIPEEIIHFGPVVDGNVLPEAPATLIAKHHFNPVDIMVGFNADEGMMAFLLMASDEKPSINRTVFEGMLPMYKVKPFEGHPLQRAAVDLVYFTDQMFSDPDNADYVDAFSQMYGDYLFGCSSIEYMRAASEADFGNRYLYHFTHAPSVSMFNLTWTGSCHADELIFFGAPWLPQAEPYKLTPEEVTLTEKMIGYWTNFAKTGNPNTAPKDQTEEDIAVEWPQYTLSDPMHRELSTNMRTGRGLKAKQCSLWNDYLPKLNAAIAEANQPGKEESCSSHWKSGEDAEAESCTKETNP